MPRVPKGERRPADVIGNAVHIMRIATGEVDDARAPPDPAKEHMRRDHTVTHYLVLAGVRGIPRQDRPRS